MLRKKPFGDSSIFYFNSTFTVKKKSNEKRRSISTLSGKTRRSIRLYRSNSSDGYIGKLQIPGGFRNWYRDFNEDDKDLNQNRLIKFAGRFSRRIYAFAEKKGIPIIECKTEERKHLIADEYLPKDINNCGLFLILKWRASANIWEIATSKTGSINIQRKLSFVNHYYFHIMDTHWGHVTIRMCSHPPFNCMIILNGHEFTERKLIKKNISFEKTDNCFAAYDNGTTLTQVADTCSIGQLEDA